MIIRYSAVAKRQMSGIWLYSTRHWGAARARRYLKEIEAAVLAAAEGRKAGSDCSDISAGLSKIKVRSHHVYLALNRRADVVEVVAVLHQQMDPKQHLVKTNEEKDDHGSD